MHYVILLLTEHGLQQEHDQADSINLLRHSHKKRAEGADSTDIFPEAGCKPQHGGGHTHSGRLLPGVSGARAKHRLKQQLG